MKGTVRTICTIPETLKYSVWKKEKSSIVMDWMMSSQIQVKFLSSSTSEYGYTVVPGFTNLICSTILGKMATVTFITDVGFVNGDKFCQVLLLASQIVHKQKCS